MFFRDKKIPLFLFNIYLNTDTVELRESATYSLHFVYLFTTKCIMYAKVCLYGEPATRDELKRNKTERGNKNENECVP